MYPYFQKNNDGINGSCLLIKIYSYIRREIKQSSALKVEFKAKVYHHEKLLATPEINPDVFHLIKTIDIDRIVDDKKKPEKSTLKTFDDFAKNFNWKSGALKQYL